MKPAPRRSRSIPMPLGLALVALAATGSACGGRAEDTTVIERPPPADGVDPEGDDPDSFDLADSRALAELSDPETLNAFCGWVGVSAGGVGAAPGLDASCEEIVGQCREVAQTAAELDSGEGLPTGLLGIPEDLEEALGCAVTTTQVDACLAELLELVVETYPDGPGCDAPAPEVPAFEIADVVALESCVGLIVACPELLQQLLQPGG